MRASASLDRTYVEEGVDVAAGADQNVDLAQLGKGLAQRAIDRLLQQPFAGAIDRLRALQVRLEQADGAEGQRHRERRRALVEQRELGRTAPDVHEQRALFAHRHPAGDRELDEASLLDALDRFELDPRLAPRALDEGRAVLGLAHGARRDGPVGIDLQPVHLGLELAQRSARLTDGRGSQAARKEDFRPEANRGAQRREVPPRLLVAGEQRELSVPLGRAAREVRRRPRRGGLDDAKPERIRAYVNGAKARHEQKLAVARVIG